ncbi:MAG: FAD/NAD(P)-binding protein [Polyangiaceae bacterium]|jgi:NAD(P)H-flavin reductase|nr:FAD/NAD(P)-binding protein [Polyangiaceae bacterium]
MSTLLHRFEVTQESTFLHATDFNRRSGLQHVDHVYKAEITNIIQLTEMEKLFHVRLVDPAERERFSFHPGQFVMIEVPGYGEVPLTIAGSATNRGYIELCIRRAGTVTSVLHAAKRGALVGVRGPFGTTFPMNKMKGHDVLLIAGGLGLAPLRAPIFYVTENRSDFHNVHIVYGARDPSNLLFDYQYEQWHRIDGVNLQIIVERPDDNWKGEVGLITKLLDKIDFRPEQAYAIVCGPPVMFKFVCNQLSRVGVPMHRMFVSLERRMHCGMGKCCRCNIGSTYTCVEGPVFDYWTVMNLKEAI